MTKEESNMATVVMFGILCVGALVIYGWSCWVGQRNTKRVQEILLNRVPVPVDEELADAEV